LSAWWDADNLGYADATPIDNASAKWTDRSGNSNHLIQATVANRPQLKTSIINSKKIVRFDGSASPNNDKLAFTSTINPGTGDYTVIVVGLYTITNGGSVHIMGNTGTASRLYRSYTAGFVEQMGLVYVAANYVSTVAPYAHGSAHMLTWRRTGSTNSMRSNKTACITPYTDATTVAWNVFGDQGWSAGTGPLKGDIGEIVIYSAYRTDAEMDNLYDTYFKPKFGLP
jgi:hypothetical protein